MAQKTFREEVEGLARRLALVEQALELTMTWQYGLRNQADELLDRLRQEALDDTAARVDALEVEIRTLRHMVQDLTQVVTSGRLDFATLPPPAVERRPGTTPGRALPAASVPAVRALTLARFDGALVRGESVDLVAVADGYTDGTAVRFEVGERGEAGEVLEAEVNEGEARAGWWVPSVLPAGTEVVLVARIPPFESVATATVTARPEPPDGELLGDEPLGAPPPTDAE
ncbi:MAG TPA: hypothetical protein VG389_18550 [Myxococcota bacterium]|jgi:hypothetical protein|nr:hypothetical protein [Myxococcota bacterium]